MVVRCTIFSALNQAYSQSLKYNNNISIAIIYNIMPVAIYGSSKFMLRMKWSKQSKAAQDYNYFVNQRDLSDQ